MRIGYTEMGFDSFMSSVLKLSTATSDVPDDMYTFNKRTTVPKHSTEPNWLLHTTVPVT